MLKKITKNSKIFVAGHNGLVGSAVLRKLVLSGYKKILTISKKKLDLRNQSQVEKFFKKNKPDAIINAAATVGGIYANNTFGADFIYNNLAIQTNIIHASYLNNVKSLVFLGSSCVYPKKCNQPIKETYLLNGKLEKTNDAYSIAKIAGVKMCEAFNSQYGLNYLCLMPSNLYGPNDNYDLKTSHFFPALLRKIYSSKIKKKKQIEIWGNGKAKRELTYVDDLADACEFFLKKKTKEVLINIGSGTEYTVQDYCKFIMKNLTHYVNIKKNLMKI